MSAATVARARAGVLGGAARVAAAACCFGSISTLIVVATRGAAGREGASLAGASLAGAPLAGASLVGVLFWRYLIAALALGVLAARGSATSEASRVGRRPALAAVVIGGLGQAGVAFLSLSALRWISVATLAFVFYTYPAWVALFAAVRGTEPLDRRKLAALALALAGIGCTIGLPGSATGSVAAAGGLLPGIVLALVAAVVYALYIPYLGALQARFSPVGASALVCAGAAVLFGAPALYGAANGGAPLLALPVAAWLAIATLAFVCTVFAFLAFLSGLARLGPVRSAIVSTVEPFFTALLGAVVLRQPAGLGTVAGGVLIALAVGLLSIRPGRATR
ncbi:MAG TPA: DMT family transporter [Gemmatirosa sp.]